MKTSNLFLHLPFLLFAGLQLFSSWTGDRLFEYIAKPFILLWIGFYFLLNTRPAPFRWMVLVAFAFSWIGDLFLMFGWKSDLFFFAGVGGFFVSQLFYILTFLYYGQGQGKGLIALKPTLILPFIAYLAVIYLLVRPGLEGAMMPVVLIYAFSLIGMAIAALNRWGLTQWRRFWLTFAGALLFVLSDSLLAYTRFISGFPKDAFIIMGSYIAAQYLIMRGILKS
jgi:uncharacterized membrane protein YhhN